MDAEPSEDVHALRCSLFVYDRPSSRDQYDVAPTCAGGLAATVESCMLDVVDPCDPVIGLGCVEVSGDAVLSWTNGEA